VPLDQERRLKRRRGWARASLGGSRVRRGGSVGALGCATWP